MKIPEKPNFNWKEKLSQTDETGRLLQLACTGEKAAGLLKKAGERYAYWDEVKEYEYPQGVTPEIFWSFVKAFRETLGYKRLFFTKDEILNAEEIKKAQFKYLATAEIMQKCALADKLASKHILSTDEKNEFGVNAMMEEALASSRIDGADTESEAAKEMLRTKILPKDISQQMIWNCYNALGFIEKNKNEPLSAALIKRIHLIITRDCAEKPGVFRSEFDDAAITDAESGAELFVPPQDFATADILDALCAFANKSGSEESLHPLISAAIVHFWFSYARPFAAGNGRTARALVYWLMLKNGYDAFNFISISSIFEREPESYKRAFLCTEFDENDLTYFINFHIDAAIEALRAFNEYAVKKKSAALNAAYTLNAGIKLNPRQQSIMEDFFENKNARNIEYFKNKLGVVYETARTDLMFLAKKKLLLKKKSGKEFIYVLNSQARRGS